MISWSTIRCTALAVVLACWSALALGQDPAATTVQHIARDWLALTDRGDGAASWDAAAHQFKNALPRERWADSLKKSRDPFGALAQRTVLSTTFATSFPGAPDGNYAMVLFRTSFAKKTDATETVTLEREADGAWRVVGYFIR
ncbi:MAG TPA: DUF4019 domain-containing protein [Casimicrobiaceae bacterium]|nr:DUF4019 domain-containing protein [Casimicrobiaceae bacterium]